MEKENMPKFILCVKYDVSVSIKNRALGAFEEHYTNCTTCAERLFITRTSLDLLTADDSVKAICQDCAEKFNRLSRAKPQFALTAGHLKEIESALVKIKAGNN